ncbi:MAG: FIVAR domain-containing protein, partial [Clostridiales bacterium]|nr:FIVAR domain-containing protein [Clostridiales bacterium]
MKKNAKKIFSLILSIALVLTTIPMMTFVANAQTVSVGTLQALKNALEDSSVDEIIVTTTITLTDGTNLYGNNKTVRAQVTGVDEQGIVQTGSTYNVFETAANATVHLYDMTVMGGSVTAIVNPTGKLYLDNVTVTRSGSEDNAGGGIVNGVQRLVNNKNQNHKTAYVVLTNSSVIRNVAKWGGGFLNYGTLIMDGCSLSENRSIDAHGGGGAGENQGYAYLNNCTVANNTSSEIGGGINVCKGGELYIMNCTFTGNVTYNSTTGGATFGGAYGVNDSCVVKAVNSIFANNYYINKSTQAVTECDIGMYNSNNIYAYNSIVGVVSGGTPHLEDCSNDTDGLFAAYVTGNVLAGDGTESTADFEKPAVVQNSSGELYTPLSGDYQGDIEGVPTYFDYSDLDNIRMYFTDEDGNDTTFFAGSGTQPTDIPVGDALDDTDRDTTLIGSSNSLGEGKTIYTIKVKASEHGSIKGGTIYGDSYIVVSDGSVVSVNEIVTVTLEATPDSGYYFSKWLFEDANAVVEPPVSASSITALESAITQAGSANNGNRRRTAAKAIRTAIINITTTNAEILEIKSAAQSETINNWTTVNTTTLQKWVTRAQNIIDINNEVVSGGGWTEVSGNNPYEFVVDQNISLKAEFVAQAPNYTVTFHSNTEPETTVTQTFAAGHYTANLTANSFTNDGQPFLGWSMVYCGDVEYADGASYTANGNADLYARWGYTVDYNANGGRNAPDSQIKNPGEALNLSSVTPSREGYTFKGWGLSADATDAILQPGDVYGVDRNLTLYAVWEELKAPTVLDTNLPDGYLDVPYSGTIETDQDAIFILSDGSTLPAGLSIGKDGHITGTPTSTGTYTFDISVYNKEDTSLSNSSTITITITISDPKAALQDLVDQANAVDQDDYTTQTAQNLQDAIDQGQTVLDDDDATLSEINDAIQDLQDALNQLTLDKSALAAAIAQGLDITEDPTEVSKYTADSIAALENALTAGEIVYENTKATAEQIAQATQAILDAINNLSREIDKDDLQELVNQANAIDQDDYTDASADALQDAIDDAQAVLDDPNATDDEIRDAYEALEDAINNLVPDKTELENAINEGNDVISGDTDAYTPASVQALEDAIAAGEAVYADPDATVQEIKDATDAIIDALNDLLEEAVDNAENTNTTGMTSESVQDLQDAIDDANTVLGNPDATAEEIADAIQAIEDAINNLTPDKTALQNAIDTANALDEDDYTSSTWDDLEDVVTAGTTVLNNPNATVDEIAQATQDILDAINNLTPDKTVLQNAIDTTNALDEDDYTASTWDDLEDAVTAGTTVLNNPDATVDEIAQATQDILDAINNLTPDKTALQNAIDTADALDEDDYTASTWDDLEDAVTAGTTVLNNPDATVDEIAQA